MADYVQAHSIFLRAVRWTSAALFVALAGCGGGADSPTPDTPTAPVITQQPADVSVAPGAAATFTVAASGTAPFS
ncbi:hypothetical protein BH10PSE17_BH10PSE17_02380 [soil metagenome]